MSIDSDTVRLLVGDTDEDNQLFTDDQIATLTALYNDTYTAAAAVADALAAKFSIRATVNVDGASVDYNRISQNYLALATRLRMQATMAQNAGIGTPVVTGISISEMDSVDGNTDRDPNRFKVGMSDFPGVEVASSGDTDTDLTQ